MNYYDLEEARRQIAKLSPDTYLILSRISRGLSNKQIVKWSGGWKFSTLKIERAVEEIFAVLELDNLPITDKDRRVLAGEIYAVYRDAQTEERQGAQKEFQKKKSKSGKKLQSSTFVTFVPSTIQA